MTLRSAQIETLKRMIERRLEDLPGETREAVGRAREETYGAIAGAVTDMGDRASATLLSDLDQAEVSRDVREMRELEAARAQIDEGTFGLCLECEDEIGFKRLLAYPAAKRCVRCQNLHERMFGKLEHPKL